MNKIVEIAKKEVGYIEKPVNKTKYGEWFGMNGVAWCGLFVSWVYDQAGFPLGNIGFTKGFAGCQTAVAYFTRKNKITNDPQEGDIVFFDWQRDGKYDHTGIFVRWLTGETFETIEGNTSLKNQSNGGMVMVRERNIDHALFIHP